jgi:uncharacterized membrane protein YgdD (TMEM256/DUF423 family)
MSKTFIITGAAFCGIAVILGALGAHWLKGKITEGLMTTDNLMSFEVGVKYQIYHGLALILLAILASVFPALNVKTAGYLFIIGTILFSGSIYFLSTKGVSGIENLRFLGPVTPLGGLLMISGWFSLIYSAIKHIN